MVFTIYGHGSHLGHVTWTLYINFRSPFLWMLHMKFGFDWPSGFRGDNFKDPEKILEIVDRRRTDHGHPISSGSGEITRGPMVL